MAVPKATEASTAAKPQKRKILYIWYIWMSLHVRSTSIVGQLYRCNVVASVSNILHNLTTICIFVN